MGSILSAERKTLAEPIVDVDQMMLKKSMALFRNRYKCNQPLESDFTIEKKVLGSGMNGPVRLATCNADGTKWAVKTFKKCGLTTEGRQSLTNETKMFAMMDHPHIARLHMVYETNELLHMVMEFMRGGEVCNKLARLRTYDEEMAANTMYQMLLAVSYLHSHGMAHRDLKLDNFLYENTETDHIKLIDFGFAKFWDATTTMSQTCGSFHYVAPEVLSQRYTLQADMWSMGIITFMLLTGGPAFHGTEEEILKKIRTSEPHYPKCFWKLSSVAQDFVQRLLVKDPTRRMTAAEALKHRWIKGRHHNNPVCLENEILDSLRTFSHASRFRRSALCMMAWSLSGEDQAGLREQFLSLDVGKRGVITLNDLKKMLEENFHVESAEAERLFQSIDSDNNHEIEYSEFLAAALDGRLRAHKDVLLQTFQALDADHSGQISSEELQSALGRSMSNNEIKGVLREMDTSGDGMIDNEEFVAYFMKPAEEPGPLEDVHEAIVGKGSSLRRDRSGRSELLMQANDSLKDDKELAGKRSPRGCRSFHEVLIPRKSNERPEIPVRLRLPVLLGSKDSLIPRKSDERPEIPVRLPILQGAALAYSYPTIA